jgi:hypothetical protein
MGGDLTWDAASTNWPDASPTGLEQFLHPLVKAIEALLLCGSCYSQSKMDAETIRMCGVGRVWTMPSIARRPPNHFPKPRLSASSIE